MDRLQKIPYTTLRKLLKAEMLNDEEPKTEELMRRMSHIAKDRRVSREEFLAMCKWKSPRPQRHYMKNTRESVAITFSEVLRAQQVAQTSASEVCGS